MYGFRFNVLLIVFALLLASGLFPAVKVGAQEDVTLTIFFSPSDLIVYVPGPGNISLADLSFETFVGGEKHTYILSEYTSLGVLAAGYTPTPLCLRLQRADANAPLPTECNPPIPVLTQVMPAAGVFWYADANMLPFIVVQGGMPIGICAPPQCEVVLPPLIPTTTVVVKSPTATRTPIPDAAPPAAAPTAVPAVVCRVTATTNANVRTNPGTSYPIVTTLRAGESAAALSRDVSGTWLNIGFAHWVNAALVMAGCDITTLPIYTPPPEVMIASFDTCNQVNDLDMGMGLLLVTAVRYVREPDNPASCFVELNYSNLTSGGSVDYGGYWIQIPSANYGVFNYLVFEARTTNPQPISLQIDLKIGASLKDQVMTTTVTNDWETHRLPLDLSTGQLTEVAFVVTRALSGASGSVYLDNIRFEQ